MPTIADDVVINSLSDGTPTIDVYAECATFTASGYSFMHFTLNADLHCAGLMSITGPSDAYPAKLMSGSSAQRAVSAGSVSLNNVNFSGITTVDSPATFSGTRVGDMGGNSGITFDAPLTLYRYQPTSANNSWISSGNWFLGSGGTGGAGRNPLPQDSVVFDAGTFGTTGLSVGISNQLGGKDFTWSGVTNGGKLVVASNLQLFGNIDFDSTINTASSAGSFLFRGVDPCTITTGGAMLNGVGIDAYSELAFVGDVATDRYVQVQGGSTFSDGGHSVTAKNFFASGTINITGDWTLTGNDSTAGGSVWDVSSATVTGAPGVVKLTDATANDKTFKGGGHEYGTIWLSGSGSGAYNVEGSNTFSEVKISDGDKTIKFTAGTTTTVDTVAGFDANAATITSRTAAAHYLVKSGEGVIEMPAGATVSYSVASPADTFYAGFIGADLGNNANWTFGLPGRSADSDQDQQADTAAAESSVAVTAGASVTQDAFSMTATAAGQISADAAVTQSANVLASRFRRGFSGHSGRATLREH